MKKFWNWVKDEKSDTRTLYLDGVIAEESWFDDDVRLSKQICLPVRVTLLFG